MFVAHAALGRGTSLSDERDHEQRARNDEHAAAANAGDRDAAGIYLKENLQYLTSMARWLAGNTMDPDDLASECIANLLALWKRGKGPTAQPNAYLIRSMRNRLIDERRSPRSRVLGLSETEHQLPPQHLATRRIDLHREFQYVQDALLSLPDDQQRVLRATVIDGRKPAELSAELNRSPSAIYSLNHRAKASLRRATLQQVLSDGASRECRHAAARLPDTIAGSPDDVADLRATEHQRSCDRCRAAWARFSSMAALGILALLVAGNTVLQTTPANASEKLTASRWRVPGSRQAWAVAAIAAGSALVVGIGLWVWSSTPVQAPAPSANQSFAPPTTADADAGVDRGLRFRVPGVDLDAPVGEVLETDGEITPPSHDAVYLVKNRGVGLADADQGTVYVVAHSLPGERPAPGNALVNQSEHRSAVNFGDVVNVGNRTYEVTGTQVVTTHSLPTRSDIWDDIPRRLVIITSLQPADGTEPTESLVITAALQS
jgi:RNA polymerase sigma factor (sigma-70 family)